MKMKCTQCGCDDLEEVDFPYEAKLDEVAVGIAGESSFYDMHEEVYTQTYICTKCGHFEFFNPELAKLVLEEREKCAKIQKEIDNFDKQISDKNNEIKNVEQQIDSIKEQLKNIDITIRQSNELKVKQQDLSNKLKALKADSQELIKRQNNLKRKLKHKK